MKLALALVCALPVAAWYLPCRADETAYFGNTEYIEPSSVVIRPTNRPGAVAEIEFHNVDINGPDDTGDTETITFGGISAEVTFGFNVDAAGADSITVEPPDGVVCVPSCTATIMERTSATIYLYDNQAVGM